MRTFAARLAGVVVALAPLVGVAPAVAQPVGHVLAVKVDNVAAARPHTGLGSARVVYVEPVEGGLTRLMAVFTDPLPPVVGPVRSVRRTDLSVLPQWGAPVLAHSGGAPELAQDVADAPFPVVSPDRHPGAFFRDPGRRSPHNLFVRPSVLPRAVGTVFPLEVGPVPGGGRLVDSHRVAYASAVFTFTRDSRGWAVAMDGAPLVSTESGRLWASTVVEQRVAVFTDPFVVDSVGSPSPVAISVGSGDAVVLREGRRFAATWSRSGRESGTRFETVDGQPLPVGDGPVWILLVPDELS